MEGVDMKLHVLLALAVDDMRRL